MLRKNEEKYRVVLNSIDEAFCIIELIFNEDDQPVDYIFLETNTAFEEQTGLQNSEGKTMRELRQDHESYWFDTYASVARTGKPVRFENYARELNRWFSVYAFRMGKPGENKIALLFKDITESKKAREEQEQLLRKIKTEREQLDEIFYNAPSFMCVLRGPDYIFERANKLYCKLVGNDDLIGKPVREAIPEAEEQGFLDQLNKVYQKGETYIGKDIPVRFQRTEGNTEKFEKHYLDFVYQPLRNSEGQINRIFVQGVDLTERKRAREELQTLNETLEERVKERTETLLAYQKKLRSLIGRLSKAEEHERQHLATELHDNLGQILTIGKLKVDQVQNIISSGKPHPAVTELEELMNEAVRYTRKLMLDLKPPPSLNKENLRESIEWEAKKIEKPDLKIIIEDDEQPKPLTEDVLTTLRQCVRELLSNVRKHSRVDEARIYLSRQDEQVQIIVEDKGVGFDTDEQKHKSDSNGYGLFNTFERMDLLGGSFELISAPGVGTKAILTAPLNIEEPELKSPEGLSDSEGQNTFTDALRSGKTEPDSKIRVLLVDDHKMMREGLKKIIKEEDGIEVIAEASDGREAVTLAHEVKPDIIVMDVNMPLMNGIEATRKITADNPDVRIIGLSLHDSSNVNKAMKNAGASAYLTKTEAIEELCATIRREAPVPQKN